MLTPVSVKSNSQPTKSADLSTAKASATLLRNIKLHARTLHTVDGWAKREHFRPAASYGKKAHHKASPVAWCSRRTPVALVNVCSGGWNLVNGVCVRTPRSASYVCPLGNSPQKGCIQREPAEADFQCPAGFVDCGKSGFWSATPLKHPMLSTNAQHFHSATEVVVQRSHILSLDAPVPLTEKESQHH
eukprot:GHVN01054533.1.p1 GENE.GHVN01054533.1~~GHVN01054533.1.p1  ORF type:complete len:188 (+),score=10.13 GHVN01054533.1:358-921(+)